MFWHNVYQNFLRTVKSWLLFFSVFFYSSSALALPYFKDEHGHTNWQYVANWSSGILIILLLSAVGRLYLTRRALRRVNNALLDSNEQLERRVLERTSTLNQSNELLQKANELLEAEVDGHRHTTRHLEASRAYVESILESMPLMLVGMNRECVVTQWNRGAESITGLPSAAILGKVLWDVYPVIPVTQDEVNRALKTHESLQVSRSQRGQLHFDIVIYPLSNTIETGVVLLIDDVTKQVQSMNQLIQKDKLSAMGELAASMAQDINLPLRKIIETLDSATGCFRDLSQSLAIKGKPDQAFPEYLEVARQESLRTLAITNNLVEFAGAHRQEARPQDIVEVMEHALALAAGIYSNTMGLEFSNITIKRNYEDDLPKVFCHVSELQQVFLSLLRHCAYALAQRANTPEPVRPLNMGQDEAANSDVDIVEGWKPTISLTLLESYEVLWIKLQHNGLGLTSAEQQMIFEPFFSNTLRHNGISDSTSLEADRRQSFSHFIVTEHHGGQLAVTSDVDIGTTFHMELPIKSG